MNRHISPMPALDPRPPAVLREPGVLRGLDHLIDRVERILEKNRPTKRRKHAAIKSPLGKSA